MDKPFHVLFEPHKTGWSLSVLFPIVSTSALVFSYLRREICPPFLCTVLCHVREKSVPFQFTRAEISFSVLVQCLAQYSPEPQWGLLDAI